MKRSWCVLMAGIFAAASLAGCGKPTAEAAGQTGNASSGAPLKIVTTIFPEYDYVRNILGDNPAGAEVSLLIDSGVDLHSFQPTVQDIAEISECDIFVYVGGESDGWVEDALEAAGTDNIIAVNLMEVLSDSIVEEELVEGMQCEEEEEGPEYDEHVWLSLRNSVLICEAIRDAIVSKDPGNASVYENNCEAYTGELRSLDERYTEVTENGVRNVLIFADRFPFRYMFEDYGLDYYAAFVGCSAETEASFETVAFLSDKMDELGLPVIMTIENSDNRIANTVIDNLSSPVQILSLDSMQSVTREDVDAGATYLGIMESNLEVLETALS
ncbi:MAG: zinc ABC transporter substrate-binding protein [Clostridiales bacterium]|nr:zinc ABC transporter substrate-binding protein [Clostridiales bacterium]